MERCIRRISQSLPSSLKRFAPAGVGVAQTSSHTNTPNTLPNAENQREAQSDIRLVAKIQQSIQSGGAWRLASHVLVAAGAIFIVGAGKIQAESLTGAKPRGLGAAAEDQSTMLAAGAVLAEQSSSLIASDVKERANSVASQAKLATTGESFLTKRAPIASGGTASRSVTNYVVVNGDTASTIAQKFGVTTDTVLWANNLEADAVLKPGTQLMILPVNGLMYAAAGNETLEELASRFQSNANLIDSYNQLEGKPLTAGQKLIIPDGVKPQPAAPAPVKSSVAVAAATPKSRPTFSASYGANGYSYGYCTYYVAGRRRVPSNWGNASQWYYNAIASGYSVGSSPRPGAIAQTSGGWGGFGHVAYVESVNGGSVTVCEMNYNGGWNRVSTRTVPASTFRYIY